MLRGFDRPQQVNLPIAWTQQQYQHFVEQQEETSIQKIRN